MLSVVPLQLLKTIVFSLPALGNVVGSNIANVLLVLGVPALMKTLATRDHDTRRSYMFMIAASLLFRWRAQMGLGAGEQARLVTVRVEENVR